MKSRDELVTDVEALCHILYGVDVAVPRSRFDKIHNLADMLGIPVSKLKKPEDFLLDPNEPRLAASQGVKFFQDLQYFRYFGITKNFNNTVQYH